MNDLLQRMEEPNEQKRWDKPLFTVTPEQELPFQQIYEVRISCCALQ
jgi:tRNA uridine 5-carbamoylmethylation protein Kti12